MCLMSFSFTVRPSNDSSILRRDTSSKSKLPYGHFAVDFPLACACAGLVPDREPKPSTRPVNRSMIGGLTVTNVMIPIVHKQQQLHPYPHALSLKIWRQTHFDTCARPDIQKELSNFSQGKGEGGGEHMQHLNTEQA